MPHRDCKLTDTILILKKLFALEKRDRSARNPLQKIMYINKYVNDLIWPLRVGINKIAPETRVITGFPALFFFR